MVYSHWLGPEPRPGQGPGLVLCRTFHIAQGPRRMGCMVLYGIRPILQVLKMFQVFFPVPVQVQCERFLLKPYNSFFPVPVPDQASINTPSHTHLSHLSIQNKQIKGTTAKAKLQHSRHCGIPHIPLQKALTVPYGTPLKAYQKWE